MKKQFPALLLGVQDDKAIDVVFPDFPGCVSQGDDIADAMCMAQEALEGHLECMTEAGESIPAEPSRLALAEAAAENPDSVVALVEVQVPEGKAQRINVTIPDIALARIDEAVNRTRGETRSGLLVKAALAYISTPARAARSRRQPVRS